MLIVSQQSIVGMGAQGLGSYFFGNVKAKAFNSLADALDYVRENTKLMCNTN